MQRHIKTGRHTKWEISEVLGVISFPPKSMRVVRVLYTNPESEMDFDKDFDD